MSVIELNKVEEIEQDDVVLLGICCDHNSSFMRGPAEAPEQIRKALFCGSANLSSELGVSIRNNCRFKDIGDFAIAETDQGYLNISLYIEDVLNQGAIPLTLGGDHAITYPILVAMAKKYSNINILHFDAHLDIYPKFEGNPFSHASPFARIMESELASKLVQVGIRTLNTTQQKQVDKYNVEVTEMRHFNLENFNPEFNGPVYISLDIDALDPAFAPGVSHFEPGGLTVRDVLTIIQRIDMPIIGADIVEYNPRRDVNNMTAMVGAKLLKEIAGKMLTLAI